MPNEKWTVCIHQSVIQVLSPLPAALVLGIRNAIANLGSNQYPEGSSTVDGLADTYQLTVGFFRIVYQIQEEQKRIKVAMVNLRIE